MSSENFKQFILDVPDFPKPGVVFKDVTPLFSNVDVFSSLIKTSAKKIKEKYNCNKLVLIESRGFLFGSALAYEMGVPFVLARKKGKLPRDTHQVAYDLEYGQDFIELHKDSFQPEDEVLIVDDLLATGGTVAAVEKLIQDFYSTKVIGVFCFIELSFLGGKNKVSSEFSSLIQY